MSSICSKIKKCNLSEVLRPHTTTDKGPPTKYIKQGTTIGRPAHMNRCLCGTKQAGVMVTKRNLRMSSATGGGRLSPLGRLVCRPEPDDPAAIAEAASRCLFCSSVIARASSMRAQLAFIHSGPNGVTWRFHGGFGCSWSAMACNRGAPKIAKLK